VTPGLGHPGGAALWADFVHNLRAVGYEGTLNIEHEDALVNSVEGVGRAVDLPSFADRCDASARQAEHSFGHQ
jgi:sugar phosphate isomerase/epimerase